MELTKEQLRLLCESCRQNGMTPSFAHEFIPKALREHATTLRGMQRWHNDFLEGTRTAVENASKSGRPCSTSTEKNVELVENYLIDWPSAAVENIAYGTSLSSTSV
jgi:hypothetical protein